MVSEATGGSLVVRAPVALDKRAGQRKRHTTQIRLAGWQYFAPGNLDIWDSGAVPAVHGPTISQGFGVISVVSQQVAELTCALLLFADRVVDRR